MTRALYHEIRGLRDEIGQLNTQIQDQERRLAAQAAKPVRPDNTRG